MATYKLHLRDNKAEGQTSIQLHIHWTDGLGTSNKLKVNTGIKVNPKNWQGDKNKPNYKKIIPINVGDHASLNTQLESLVLKLKIDFNQFATTTGNPPLKSEMLELINPDKKETAISLFDYFEQYISDADKRFNPRTQKFISKGTIKTYKNTLLVMRDHHNWAQSQKGSIKIQCDFPTLNMDWYYSFLDWCIDERGYQLNNIGKYIKTIKAMLNTAKDEEKNPYDFYLNKKFMAMSEEVENIYLNEDELEEIAEADFPIGSALDHARDLFLIGCWTGLRASDFLRVSKEQLKENYISITTMKTGHKVVIPVNDVIRNIHTKYQDKSLPDMSPQKVNQYIKIVGMRVLILHTDIPVTRKFKREVTIDYVKKYNLICTHTARRSFATNMYKIGVSTKDIMAITGHRTEAQFFKYIKITPQESAERMKVIMDANTEMRAKKKKEREEEEQLNKNIKLNVI